MRVTLGFDTSCYTTSAAAVDEHGAVVAAERMLLPVREGQRGLRQSEAVFAHVRQMPQVMEALGRRLNGAQIAAVCASARPRDGEDSYMPVFTVGLGHASVLASALGVPLYETSHQQGHIAAGLIGHAAPEGPFVALHLSGGTTELLDCRDGDLILLGGSADLHAGQLVDRLGVAMGLAFPCGARFEALARQARERSLRFPASVRGLDCSLSGAEAQAKRLLASGAPAQEVAYAVYDFLARTLARLLASAARQTGRQEALLCGGVASSALLRELLAKRLAGGVRLYFGQSALSGDNAVGAALLAADEAGGDAP